MPPLHKMKHTTFFATYCIILTLITLVGCGKTPPPGLPPLAPCKVKVHDSGRPLANIGVFFQRTEGQSGWSLSGQTGADGIAVAQTVVGSFTDSGLPIGTYRVTVYEPIELPQDIVIKDASMPEKQRNEMLAKQKNYFDEHRSVPAILGNSSQTPLKLTLTESGAELDVDISTYK